jgi:hypothetical protein
MGVEFHAVVHGPGYWFGRRVQIAVCVTWNALRYALRKELQVYVLRHCHMGNLYFLEPMVYI